MTMITIPSGMFNYGFKANDIALCLWILSHHDDSISLKGVARDLKSTPRTVKRMCDRILEILNHFSFLLEVIPLIDGLRNIQRCSRSHRDEHLSSRIKIVPLKKNSDRNDPVQKEPPILIVQESFSERDLKEQESQDQEHLLICQKKERTSLSFPLIPSFPPLLLLSDHHQREMREDDLWQSPPMWTSIQTSFKVSFKGHKDDPRDQRASLRRRSQNTQRDPYPPDDPHRIQRSQWNMNGGR